MASETAFLLTDEEKQQFIALLQPELIMLRTKAGISQGELSDIIGVSRQTYGAVERGNKTMSWSTFLSLVLYFDFNKNTHRMLRKIGAIPQQLLKKFNGNKVPKDINLESFLGEGSDTVLSKLDEQALQSIRTMILVEYARCTSTSGDIVLKSFDGVNFVLPKASRSEVAAEKALKAIKEKKKKHADS